MDLEAALQKRSTEELAWKGRFKEFWEEIDKIAFEVDSADPSTEKSALLVAQLGLSAKKLAKDIDALEKQVTSEQRAFIQTVRNFVRPWLDKLKAIEAAAKAKCDAWRERERVHKLAQEKRLQEERQQIVEDIKKEAERLGVEVQEVALPPAPVVPMEPEVIRTEAGTASTARVWTWEPEQKNEDGTAKIVYEITDEAGNRQTVRVPDEYLTLNDSKITKSVLAGVRNIPGIRIYQKEVTRFRTR